MASVVRDREAILDAALNLAADRHWERLRLAQVAEEMGVSLADLQVHVAEKEDLVDCFWDRADRHMLARGDHPDFRTLTFPDNYEACVMNWLALPLQHQRSFREMMLVRMEPGHLHIQLPTLLRVSRTVQWMRELCRRDQVAFVRRATEETVLSSLFVAALVESLWDDSHGAEKTRGRLHQRLAGAVRLGAWWPVAGA